MDSALKDLLRYTQKADAIVIDKLLSIPLNLQEVNKLFSHVLNAQHIWITRILELPSEVEVWQCHEKESFGSLANRNFELIAQVLVAVPLSKNISYSNSKGDTFDNSVSDMLLHLCNHSTYHRAQIATLIKNAGYVPPVTDYIILKRTNQL